MAMTKKDYQLVAKALANQRIDINKCIGIELDTLDKTIEIIAAHFALMNDRFNSEVFKEAASYGTCDHPGL